MSHREVPATGLTTSGAVQLAIRIRESSPRMIDLKIMNKLLVIDDDHSFRRNVATLLRSQGYEPLEADSGETALEMLNTHSADLVLCDMHMPGLDGLDVLQAVRANESTASVPVILMTGEPDQSTQRRGMEQGADDYLPKPFSAESLRASIEAQLRKRRIQLERQEQENARLVAILEATTDLVAMVDARSYHLLYLNQAGRKMLEIPVAADLSEFSYLKLFAGMAAELLIKEIVPSAIRHGVWTGETVLQPSVDREIPVSQMVLAHRCPDGNIDYLSTIVRDITELKQAERDQRMMELQLRQAQKLESIGQLAAGIAHEINTPTQYVGDNTRFLRDSFTDIDKVLESHRRILEAARDNSLSVEMLDEAQTLLLDCDVEYLSREIPSAIQQTLEGVDRVTRLVRSMKDFSHPGGKDKTPSNLNKAIESTTTVARNEWKYVSDLRLDLEPNLPLVPCFLGEFNQAILNLVINAAHAIGEVVKDRPGNRGEIVVQTRRDGDHVEVRVRDDGGGIPKEIRSRVFEPFFTTKTVGRGTGQGLSMVYNSIVKKHGGTVRFETESGKGTTFILRLPVAPVIPAAQLKHESAREIPEQREARV